MTSGSRAPTRSSQPRRPYYEAVEVARRISAGELETPYRSLDSALNTMATLDLIRRAVRIDFSAAGLRD
jgi:hypothetical protein